MTIVCRSCGLSKHRSYFSAHQRKGTKKCHSCVTSPEDKIRKLVKWLRENNCQIHGLRTGPVPDCEYRGVLATKLLRPKTEILTVPKKCIISSRMALHSSILKRLGPAVQDLYSPHSPIALFLLSQWLQPDSFWTPYLESLPHDVSEMPVFFEEKWRRALEKSICGPMLKQRLFEMKHDWEIISSSIPEVKRNFNFFDFKWARTMAITRVFGGHLDFDVKSQQGIGEKAHLMVPMADLLNHRTKPQTHWIYNPVMEKFQITTTKYIKKGQEICDSYGEKCNSRYFVNYGFLLPNNENHNETAIFIPVEKLLSKRVENNQDNQDVANFKRQLIGPRKCYDDGHCGYRRLVHHKLETEVTKNCSHRFQFTTGECSQNALYFQNCMTILRIVFATMEDLKSDAFRMFNQKEMTCPVLSQRNEQQVVATLKLILSQRAHELSLWTDCMRKETSDIGKNIYQMYGDELETVRWYLKTMR